MSIIEKMTKIINEGDSAGAEELIHDDFQFLMHSSGKSLTKKDVVGWVGMKDVKKSKMIFAGLKKPEQIADLIAYLKSLK